MSLLQPTLDPSATPATIVTPSSSMTVSDNNTMISINKSTFEQYCSTPRAIYSVFHTIMFLIAIFLSFRCNRGFSLGSFLVACFCPPIYIFYILITEYDKGICDLIPARLPLAK